MNHLDWIDINEKMPPLTTDRNDIKHIVIAYAKTGKNYCSYLGQKGLFMTQGYMFQKPGENLDGSEKNIVFYDYTDRQIQNLNAKASKNKVMYWAEMPNSPKRTLVLEVV